MPCGCDEVQQNVHAVVAESGVTLNTRFLCENIIVLTLEVADDLSKAACCKRRRHLDRCNGAYLASLSIWSPKPGVSTMVSEMRVPSSSSSGMRQLEVLVAIGVVSARTYQL